MFPKRVLPSPEKGDTNSFKGLAAFREGRPKRYGPPPMVSDFLPSQSVYLSLDVKSDLLSCNFIKTWLYYFHFTDDKMRVNGVIKYLGLQVYGIFGL